MSLVKHRWTSEGGFDSNLNYKHSKFIPKGFSVSQKISNFTSSRIRRILFFAYFDIFFLCVYATLSSRFYGFVLDFFAECWKTGFPNMTQKKTIFSYLPFEETIQSLRTGHELKGIFFVL